MLFPTLEFALFFIIVFALNYQFVAQATLRKAMLLVASYVFYAWWDWRFTSLLAGSSLLNYLAGLAVVRAEGRPILRRIIIGLAIAANLGVLAFFKYFDFFLGNLAVALRSVGLERDLPLLQIILPVGISFFTFQGISYVVDVARKEIPAARSPLDLFLYISFFPQLVAGPIVRASHFLPQLAQRPQLSRARLGFGLALIISGLFKKMVIANYLASVIVDDAFFDPSARGGVDLLMGVYGYAIQIYCDFSGYSDIGIGVAALLGFHFHANFNQPYRASSLQDFWRRWHISLSQWLRDYLYKPLGGSRGGPWLTYRNLFITMLLGGLWHGASWTFVTWGLIHGVMLGVERAVRGWLKPAPRPLPAGAGVPDDDRARAARPPDSIGGGGLFGHLLAVLFTFHVVCLAWIFFRAPSFDIALTYLEGLTRIEAPVELTTPFVLVLLGCGFIMQVLPERSARVMGGLIGRLGPWGLGLFVGLGVFMIEVIGPEGVAPFIYFRF